MFSLIRAFFPYSTIPFFLSKVTRPFISGELITDY